MKIILGTFFDKNSILYNFINLKLLDVDNVWLAGGAIRCVFSGETIQDFDLFFRNRDYFKGVKNRLERLNAKLIFQCPQGELHTYMIDGMKIQLIVKKFYSTAVDLIDSFDFTICQFAYDGKVIETYENCLQHLVKKELHINKIEYPIATINRMVKYAKRGYKHTKCCLELFNSIQDGILKGQYSPENLQLYIE